MADLLQSVYATPAVGIQPLHRLHAADPLQLEDVEGANDFEKVTSQLKYPLGMLRARRLTASKRRKCSLLFTRIPPARQCLYPLSIHFESLQIREHLLLHAPQNYNWICSDATEYQLCPANPPVCSIHVRLISLPAETVSLDCAALNVLDLRLAVPVSSNQTNRNHRVPPNTSHSLDVRLMLG